MTSAEMLTMFARIRGIRESLIEWVVNHSLSTVGIGEYANKLIGTYRYGVNAVQGYQRLGVSFVSVVAQSESLAWPLG